MTCKICGGATISLGTIPFDRNNKDIPIINDTPIEYVRCTNCDSIFCPEMLEWTPEDLGEKVYNTDYVKYDPDYLLTRPQNWYEFFIKYIHMYYANKFTHLDYGSGSGIMSNLLKEYGWNSTAYDPYSNNIIPDKKFDFITAIEVIEHSLNIEETLKDMISFLNARTGVICFSTLLASKETDINWWYIGARNGHINIVSEKALKIIAKRLNMFYTKISDNLHVFQKSRNNMKELLGLVLENGR